MAAAVGAAALPAGFSAEFAALNPINALLIFVLALHLGRFAWRKTRELDLAPA